MNAPFKSACALFSLSLAACAQLQTSPSPAPGAPKSASTQALGIGADVLQDTTPVDQINSYLDGFHFQAAGYKPSP